MSSERDQPPSYAQAHNPKSIIQFQSVPATDLPTLHHERTLPPLPLVPPEPPRFRPEPAVEQPYSSFPQWPSSNPLTAYYQPGPSQLSPTHKVAHGMDSPSAMDTDSSTPDSRGRRCGSVLSIDDPDVRIAAEALGDLRAGKLTGAC